MIIIIIIVIIIIPLLLLLLLPGRGRAARKCKQKCHGDVYTLSQGFVWIEIVLFNQLAEFWVAYFWVAYLPATSVACTRAGVDDMANLWTKVLYFRGFDSSRILILRGGILAFVRNSQQSLSQRILAGRILVRRLGVCDSSNRVSKAL